MNIPFYRYVKYNDDGHYIYQCLQCGKNIDTGHYHFDPNFCCWCGVKYKGFILPPKIDCIYIPSITVITYCVEQGADWKDGKEIIWEETWRKTKNAKEALQLLKEAREENEIYKDYGLNKFRLNRIKTTECSYSILINVDKFKLKTNKKFNKNDYQRRK